MTFVELMIAGFLMLMLFLIGMFISQGFVGVTHARDYETAILLANQTIEAVRAARSHQLGEDNDGRRDTLLYDFSSADNIFDHTGEGFLPVIKVGNVEYKRRLSIESIPSTNPDMDSGLKQIRVLITWKPEESSRETNYEVITLHSDQW